MAEIWKPICETSGDYEVSNTGKIRSARKGIVMKPRKLPTGYYRVHLPVEHGRKDFYVHRLVASAFCEHPDGCNVVNHIDNNPQNNNADNIEWTTQRGNVLHAMRQGRVKGFPNAKMVTGIKDGIEKTYNSSKEAQEITGCDASTIIKCCRGKKKQIHGYCWKYAEVV